MKTLLRFFLMLALVSLVHASFVYAETGLPIQFSNLKSLTSGENSSLSGECDGNTNSLEVTCRFTQLMVSYQLDPKELASETQKRLTGVRSEFTENPAKFVAGLCGELKKNRAELEQKIKDIKNPHTIRITRELMSACANPTLTAIEGWFRTATQLESKTCKVSQFQNNPVTYKKVGSHKWVANVGPEGLCNSVFLYTMERDPKYTSLWKWSQVRTYADTSGSFCKGMEVNKKVEFSWKGNDPDLVCEAIMFGR